MWRSHQHDDQFGPKAAAFRNTKGEEAGSMDMPISSTEAATNRNANTIPATKDAGVL